MLLSSLAQYLENQGYGTFSPSEAGGTIYLDRVPDKPDDLIALFATGGFGDTGDYDQVEANPTVQVRVRDSNPQQAESRAWALWRVLHRLHGVTLPGGEHIIDTEALQPPTWFERDPTGRTEMLFNVRFRETLPEGV